MATALELLSTALRQAVVERGFSRLSRPQEAAIPHILKGENVLLVAPTGTGKTEAALLPIFDLLLRARQEGRVARALYITPLRALNRDLLDRVSWWCRRLDLRLAVRHGDTPLSERRLQSLAPPDILITTPETLQVLLVGRRLRRQLASVRWVVVDEIHELATDKRGSQLSIALERLELIAGHPIQRIGLSATVGSPERVARLLVGTERGCTTVRVDELKALSIRVEGPEATAKERELSERVLFTYPEVAARVLRIRELLEAHRSALIFTNTRSEAEALGSRFRLLDINYPVAVHHSSLSRATRLAVEEGLKLGRLKGVICTSSLEMGIDIGQVELVIQYGSPRQVVRLVQRVGRSGHGLGEVSQGSIITLDPEDLLESMVIARRALEGRLEETSIPEAPYDALAHQLAGLIIEYAEMSLDDVYRIVTKAYPYRNLGREELLSVVAYLSSRRPPVLHFDRRSSRLLRPINPQALFEYYFDNLTMIPEQRQFLVVDQEGNPIGVLDELFVIERGTPGTRFVEAGRVWRIRAVGEQEVSVEPYEDPLGAIPTWVGDEIPVPLEVAWEVGKVRALVGTRAKQGASEKEVAAELAQSYPVEPGALSRALGPFFEHAKSLPVWGPEELVVEGKEGHVIVHACYGSLVNNLLAHCLAYLLSSRTGAKVQLLVDPYRIALSGPGIGPGLVFEELGRLCAEDIDQLARTAFAESGAFRKRFVQVAQKMGVITKDSRLDLSLLSSLIDSLRGTPVYEEAMRTTLREDADLEGLKRILALVREGRVRLVQVEAQEGLSALARLGLERMKMKLDIVKGERLRALLLNAVRSRLLSEGRTFACTGCWSYIRTMRVLDYWSEPACPRCGSRALGMSAERPELIEGLASRLRLGLGASGQQGRLLKRLKETAVLLERYGIAAALALVAKGATPGAAKRLLEEEHELGDALIAKIIELERKGLRFLAVRARKRTAPDA
jgi:ATP-dependent Lhr-like helicase